MEAHYAWAHIPGISVLGNEELYHNLVILYLHTVKMPCESQSKIISWLWFKSTLSYH